MLRLLHSSARKHTFVVSKNRALRTISTASQNLEDAAARSCAQQLLRNANQTRFKLEENFLVKYNEVTPPFGFNGLGELVYLRT